MNVLISFLVAMLLAAVCIGLPIAVVSVFGSTAGIVLIVLVTALLLALEINTVVTDRQHTTK